VLTAPGDWGPDTTGWRVNNLGNASSAASENGSHLANHYISLDPDGENTSTYLAPNQIVTYLPWWCDISPKWDGVVGERSPLIAAGTSYAIMLRDGSAEVVDSSMTSLERL
jgi:hypothetical protein